MLNKFYSFDNFNIDVNGSTLLIIVWGLYAGIVIGIFLALICRVWSGRIVAKLQENGADCPEKAKSLSELGIDKPAARRMLKAESSLRRYVLCVKKEEEEQTQVNGFVRRWHKFTGTDVPEKTDFSSAKFYIPEDNRIGAELRYPKEKAPVRSFILAAVVLAAVAFFAIYAVPELLTMVDNFVTQVKPQSKFY